MNQKITFDERLGYERQIVALMEALYVAVGKLHWQHNHEQRKYGQSAIRLQDCYVCKELVVVAEQLTDGLLIAKEGERG